MDLGASGMSVTSLETISEWIYPVGLCYRLPRAILDDFLLINCAGGVISYHEVSDAFYKVDHFYPYFLEEIKYVPSPNYHYCFWLNPV